MDAAAVLVTFLVLGVLGAVTWWLLVDPAVYTKSRGGGAMGEVDLARRFDADGWYSVIAVVAGFLAGAGLTWWRARDVRLTTALVVVGSLLAAVVMARVGALLGPESSDVVLAAVRRGATVPVQLEVTAVAAYLMWPMATIVGALMVLWSSPRTGTSEPLADRDLPECEPPHESDQAGPWESLNPERARH